MYAFPAHFVSDFVRSVVNTNLNKSENKPACHKSQKQTQTCDFLT